MMRKQSFKGSASPVRVDRSDIGEDGEMLEGAHSLLNPDNISVEDVPVRRTMSSEMARGSRNPLQLLIRRENRANNKKSKKLAAQTLPN